MLALNEDRYKREQPVDTRLSEPTPCFVFVCCLLCIKRGLRRPSNRTSPVNSPHRPPCAQRGSQMSGGSEVRFVEFASPLSWWTKLLRYFLFSPVSRPAESFYSQSPENTRVYSVFPHARTLNLPAARGRT